ncbi:hypothetical protein HK096_000408, partial [Nowakowskiella sp. JEL0078]
MDTETKMYKIAINDTRLVFERAEISRYRDNGNEMNKVQIIIINLRFVKIGVKKLDFGNT